MKEIAFFLADVAFEDILANAKKVGPSKSGLSFLLAAIGLVVVVILIWAVFIRKRDDDRSRRYVYDRSAPSSERQPSANSGALVPPHSRHKRRRRRDHRPRNPTLAETGGLPPVRSETPSDDPP